jgi:chromate reductase
MKPKRILAFSGSLRTASLNHAMLGIVADAARAAGTEVSIIRLRDFPMPLYNQELEDANGMPEKAAKLKRIFAAHDAFLIASPEYNSSYSAALKNAIDWVSRAESADEPPLSVFAGKKAAILAASPGGYGGARGLLALRTLLENIRVTVLPDQVSVPKAHEKTGTDGTVTDAATLEALRALGTALAKGL